MQATSTRPAIASWAVVMVLFALTTAVESLSWTQLTAYTPKYLGELGVPPAGIPGWIAAMSSLGWLLALPLAPFWGVLADRYSRKLVIVRSAVLEGAIFLGWALSTTPLMATVFRSLNGLVLGNTGVMLAVQASTTPKQKLALAVGFVSAGSPLGRAIGPFLGALLVHRVDVRGMLVVDAIASFAMAGLLMLLVEDGEHERPADLRVFSLLRGALDEILSKPLIWRLFAATFVSTIGLWTMLPYLPIYIARLAPSDPVLAVGIVLSAIGLGGAVAAPLWGLVMQRAGQVRVLSLTSAGACAALLVAAFSSNLYLLTSALIVNSICIAAVTTASMSVMAATVSPERRGAVLGQILFPFYVGGLVGPLIGVVAFGIGQVAVFATAALLALGPLILLQTMRPRPA